MGDLSCGSERVSMEDHDIASDGKDGTFLLEEALPLAGQTLCSCGELYHSQDGTHEQCMDGDSVETEMDISVSPSSGVKRGKGIISRGDENSRLSSVCSEPKEFSTYEHTLPFPPSGRLISAMKGGREQSGKASPTEVRRVKWAPDVYDPPVTSVDHSVKNHQQRPRSRKDKIKQKLKKKKRKSRGKNSGLHDTAPTALQDPGPSSPDDFGDLEPEVVDHDIGGSGGQEANHESGFAHEMVDEATSSRQDSY